MLRASAVPMIASDFQSVLAALILLQRTEDGRYPPRNPLQDPWLLPMTEAVRQTIITVAVDRDIAVVATSSDGSPARRAHMLERLGPNSVERIIDPGIDVVSARLSGPSGELSDQCRAAITRFYGRR